MSQAKSKLVEQAEELAAQTSSNGHTNDVDMSEFDFDPYTASMPTTTGKLIYNGYEKSPDAYNEKSGKPAVPQWVMAFQDGLRGDWNNPEIPRILNNRVNLAYWKMKDKEGNEVTPELIKHRKGSIPVEFASMSFEQSKINLSPATSESDKFLNGWFKLVQYTFGASTPYPKKLWVPVKFLGYDTPQEVLDYEARAGEQAAGGSW